MRSLNRLGKWPCKRLKRGEKSAAPQTETRLLLQLSRHFTGLWAPLSHHRPSQQPSTLWHAYIYEVLTQLLFVVADSSANRKTHARTHTPTRHSPALLKQTTTEMAVSHLIRVSSIKASTLLAHGGVKDTVWEWDWAFSVFPESCPDHPGKYKRANPFQVASMTRDCHMNRCRPSPAPAGSAVGSGRRLYGEVFWEGLWIETYSWEAKVTLFITTSRGSWLPGSHSDL